MQKMIRILAVLFGLGACALARADGQIYLCVDADGHKELTDVSKKGNCKQLDLPGAIAAPQKRSGTAAPHAVSAPVSTPSSFPKVDTSEQKARDGDRRQILQEELKSEEQKLVELKKEFNGGEPERNGNERNYAKYQERVAQMKDGISRVEKNIEALKREIANIR
ncbi:hypothetical protein AAKU55_004379 [Oxalobacteraceae bacterium GrIS 1.11]